MDLRRRIDGKRNSEIFPMLFDRPLSREEVRAFEHEKESEYRELSRGRLQVMPGAVALIDYLDARRIPIAIATSAPAVNVAHTLAEIGLATRLTRIVRSDEVPRGKPAPDVYVEAARRLGVPPADCLAFEDAPIGVEAAKQAGMRCVAIASTFTRDALAASEPRPDAVYVDFAGFLAGDGGWLVTGAA
jgi:HAD superfamily hydrolase (TIGR01509 family)